MKKRLFSIILVLCMVLTLIPISAFAASNGVKAKLDAFMQKYPDGTKWTGTFDGGNTCYGFAKMAVYNVFGKSTVSGKTYRSWLYNGTSSSGMQIVGQLSKGNYTEANVKALLQKAKVGDVLQLDSNKQHSMIIYSVNSNSVTVYDCNTNGDSVVHLHNHAFDFWKTRDSDHMTLLRSDNYDSVNNSGSGGYTTPTISISGGNYPTSINQGDNFGLRGTISTDCGKLTLVRGVIYNSAGTAVQDKSENPNSASYSVKDGIINKELKFGSLSSGTYRYALYAKAVNGDKTTEKWIYNQTFTVKGSSGYDTPDITISPTSVNLYLSGTKSATIKYSYTGDTANGYAIDFINSNSSVATTSWATSTEGVTVTAESVGTSEITIMLVEYNTNKILDSATCKVTVSCDHSYNISMVYPTCTSGGYTLHTCKYCNHNYKDHTTFALGHSWNSGVITKQPTETSTGVMTYTCALCGTTRTETVPVLTHTHSYIITVTAATCTEQGYTTHTCTCGDSYKDNYVDALGHQTAVKNAKAATCTEQGYTGDKVCTVCSTVVEQGKTIAKFGHSYADGVCTRCCAKDPNYKPPVVKENPFVDVSESSVYYDAILWAYYHEPQQITGGFDATHFVPGNPCTRAQVVTFLWRAAGCPEPAGDTSIFKDAESIAAPFQKAVAWAVEKGITAGYNDGTFRPNDPVTRAQFVTFLWRYENKPATTGSIAGFADASSIAAPYQQAVAWAVEKGITTGYNDGTFRPNATCTRWAVVLFMYRDMA